MDEGNKLPDIISSKPVILAGLQLTAGERVLDLGCGLGDDTFAMARLVGGQGHAVGVDVSESMILEARRRAASRQLPVEFVIDDAQTLHFEDASFDACRTERMLMHVPDAERAFAEMVRVIRRGGRLSVFDFDWETQIVDSPYKETTRLITHSIGTGSPMRQIAEWLAKIDLERYAPAFIDNVIDVDVLRYLTDADLEKIGVSLGHRRKLLAAIAQRHQCSLPAN